VLGASSPATNVLYHRIRVLTACRRSQYKKIAIRKPNVREDTLFLFIEHDFTDSNTSEVTFALLNITVRKAIINVRCLHLGISQGSHAVLKVLNCEIGFQDLEKILNSAKMYIKY